MLEAPVALSPPGRFCEIQFGSPGLRGMAGVRAGSMVTESEWCEVRNGPLATAGSQDGRGHELRNAGGP